MVFKNRISKAVLLYLGYRRASFPQQNPAAVARKFGVSLAEILIQEVEDLLAEAAGLTENLNGDLASAGRVVKSEMKRRHPELAGSAASALAWYSTFEWR